MRDRLSGNLSLKSIVEDNGMDKRNKSNWDVVELVEDFPRMSDTMLRVLTLGTYQLKLSRSYVQEYLSGDCDIQVHREIEGLLRVKLQSRHVSSKSYLLWIKYFWSSGTMECTCMLFIFENGVLLMRQGASVVWHHSLVQLYRSIKKSYNKEIKHFLNLFSETLKLNYLSQV